jgi:hypothetical protein
MTLSKLLKKFNESDASQSNLDIIDVEVVEVVKKPLKIRIEEN